MSELTGKRALVTGASSGIGAAIARELAALGVDLVLTARRRAALDAVAAECIARGVRVEVIAADLGAPAAAGALWTAARAGGPVDILINNASLVELSRRFVDDRSAGFPQDRAYLVNIASIGAYQAVPHMAVYAASKAFVRNFTEALHDELRPSPISVTCVCPGGTATRFHAMAGAGNY